MMMRKRQHRRGFTLMEMLIVLAVMGVMAAMSGGVFSGVLDYFRGRRAAEILMWDLRRLHQQARSRGNTPAVFGVKFYAGRALDGAVEPTGFSYLPYGPLIAEPPAATLGALTPNERSLVVNIDVGVRPVVDGQVATPVTLPLPVRIQFQRDPVTGDYRPDLASPARVDLFVESVGTYRLTIEGGTFVGVRFIGL